MQLYTLMFRLEKKLDMENNEEHFFTHKKSRDLTECGGKY